MVNAKRLPRRLGSPTLAAAVSAALAMAGTASAQIRRRARRDHRHGDPPRRKHPGRVGVDQRLRHQGIEMRGLQRRRLWQVRARAFRSRRSSPAARRSCSVASRRRGCNSEPVSSSGLYLDEQPITQSGRNPDPRLIDIERIEALRGPQGTLYGASSQSGTLRVITNKPDPTEFDAWVEAKVIEHRRAAARATTSTAWSTSRSCRIAWRCGSSASPPRMPATSTTSCRSARRTGR